MVTMKKLYKTAGNQFKSGKRKKKIKHGRPNGRYFK